MLNRDQTLAALSEEIDVIVVGGGINGAVSTAALAARGVNVVLAEANDFASMTSQESSNMIWGGIKYLQDYEFGLVWALCRSRNQLLSKYPNRVKQIPFFAIIGPTSPFNKTLGYIGSLLYWFFGRFKTNRPRQFQNSKISRLNNLINLKSVKGAIQYNDAILLDNDARFVYEFIKTAAQQGAKVLNYFEITSATKTATGWQLSATDKLSGKSLELKAKVLINAAGPQAKIVTDKFKIPTNNEIVISKGVHLIVPRIETNEKVLAFFDDTGRLFYVLPMHDRTVIGTTDTPATSASVEVTPEDRNFLLAQANRCLNLPRPLTVTDIISERCGVRPLVVSKADHITEIDWVSLSRKHVVELNPELKSISIFGGKLTDCINVGHEVVELVQQLGIRLSAEQTWIGEPDPAIPDSLITEISKYHPSSAQEIATQLWRRHATAARLIVDRWKLNPLESELVFDGLYFTVGELLYIVESEHVITAADLLRRRTPIALVRNEAEISTNIKLIQVLAKLK
jgi:glycerol-3-phosphate dehydrogenase